MEWWQNHRLTPLAESIKCLTAFFIRAHVGYCEVQKEFEEDEILQNNRLIVSH